MSHQFRLLVFALALAGFTFGMQTEARAERASVMLNCVGSPWGFGTVRITSVVFTGAEMFNISGFNAINLPLSEQARIVEANSTADRNGIVFKLEGVVTRTPFTLFVHETERSYVETLGHKSQLLCSGSVNVR